MSGEEELREALAGVLAAPVPGRPGIAIVRIWGRDTDDASVGVEANLWAGTPTDVADLLLPVVLRYGRDKAAEELRAAADDEYLTFTAIHNGQTLRCHPIDDLYDRANELAPQDPP